MARNSLRRKEELKIHKWLLDHEAFVRANSIDTILARFEKEHPEMTVSKTNMGAMCRDAGMGKRHTEERPVRVPARLIGVLRLAHQTGNYVFPEKFLNMLQTGKFPTLTVKETFLAELAVEQARFTVSLMERTVLNTQVLTAVCQANNIPIPAKLTDVLAPAQLRYIEELKSNMQQEQASQGEQPSKHNASENGVSQHV